MASEAHYEWILLDIVARHHELNSQTPDALSELEEKIPNSYELKHAVLVDSMVDAGYFSPCPGWDSTGRDIIIHGCTRGLTIKGWQRHRALKHRYRTWMADNWFALGVLGTSLAGTMITGLVASGVL